MTKSFDLVFKLHFHAEFDDVDLVEDFEEFGDQFLLTNVLVIAITISRYSRYFSHLENGSLFGVNG